LRTHAITVGTRLTRGSHAARAHTLPNAALALRSLDDRSRIRWPNLPRKRSQRRKRRRRRRRSKRVRLEALSSSPPSYRLRYCVGGPCCSDDRRGFSLCVRCLVRPRKPACAGGSCNVFRGRFAEYARCAGEDSRMRMRLDTSPMGHAYVYVHVLDALPTAVVSSPLTWPGNSGSRCLPHQER